MRIKIFLTVLLMIFAFNGRVFAEMPEISAGETYFDIMRGVYVLKNNVYVAANNHGFKATITADEALVSVVNQKCWAEGNVKLTQDTIIFSCDRAYLQWQTKTAEVTGNVNFENKNSVTIASDTAIFNWQEKIVDFYGNITLKVEENVKFADGVELDGKNYEHIQYNVVENTILALDKAFDAPEIKIPTADED